MPNYCNYEMRIKGKEENRLKLVDYLRAYYNYDYDYNTNVYELKECTDDYHFSRVFEAEVSDNEGDYTEVYGYCAWSVHSCMFSGNGTYYDNFKDAISSKATNMLKATKELDLVVEIFSEEPGCCFMEHFIVDKGTLKVNECVDWEECYDEDGEPIYDENGFQKSIGGIEWEYTI